MISFCLLYNVKPCLDENCCEYENDADHQTTGKLEMEKVLGKEVASYSSHEKRENESNPKRDTICQLFYAVPAEVLTCSSIIVCLAVNICSFTRNWAVHHSIFVFVFQLLNELFLFRCSFAQLNQPIDFNLRYYIVPTH